MAGCVPRRRDHRHAAITEYAAQLKGAGRGNFAAIKTFVGVEDQSVMSIFNVRMAIVVLATALSAAAYAAPKQAGGHGAGASHGGGGPRAGSAHISHTMHSAVACMPAVARVTSARGQRRHGRLRDRAPAIRLRGKEPVAIELSLPTTP